MSQVAPKSQRPTLSLNAQLVGNIKNKPRSNTPSSTTDKSDSRSSTPAQQLIEGNDGQSPKGKRRVSNDSAKVRASPKPAVVVVVDDVEKDAKNGHTNGTNGAHVEGNGVENKKETTPKGSKKEKDEKSKKEMTEETVKPTPEKKNKKHENVVILGEKTQPEMEKLVLEPDTPADSPMPKSIGKSPGRILKYTPGKGRVSPFKTAAERLQNASTIVNLSTVSEQSTESTSAAPSPAVTYDSPVKPPTGRVSGRRNTRPIKEIKMLHPINDSTSSITANLGSPVHNDSLRTPIISQLIGRKRSGDTSPSQMNDDIHVDSPSKRARIDFSGFLGYVTTPVTLLKSRLSRIGLTASTPRALDVDENIADVSAMETDETSENKKDVSKAVEATESTVEKEIEDIKAENVEKLTENTDIETPPTPTRRRSVCNIM